MKYNIFSHLVSLQKKDRLVLLTTALLLTAFQNCTGSGFSASSGTSSLTNAASSAVTGANTSASTGGVAPSSSTSNLGGQAVGGNSPLTGNNTTCQFNVVACLKSGLQSTFYFDPNTGATYSPGSNGLMQLPANMTSNFTLSDADGNPKIYYNCGPNAVLTAYDQNMKVLPFEQPYNNACPVLPKMRADVQSYLDSNPVNSVVSWANGTLYRGSNAVLYVDRNGGEYSFSTQVSMIDFTAAVNSDANLATQWFNQYGFMTLGPSTAPGFSSASLSAPLVDGSCSDNTAMGQTIGNWIVSTYNLIGKPGGSTTWQDHTVIRAGGPGCLNVFDTSTDANAGPHQICCADQKSEANLGSFLWSLF